LVFGLQAACCLSQRRMLPNSRACSPRIHRRRIPPLSAGCQLASASEAVAVWPCENLGGHLSEPLPSFFVIILSAHSPRSAYPSGDSLGSPNRSSVLCRRRLARIAATIPCRTFDTCRNTVSRRSTNPLAAVCFTPRNLHSLNHFEYRGY